MSPVAETEPVKTTWADDVEEPDEHFLPPATEVIQNNIKTVTLYERNEEGKKVKITRQYRIEKIRVAKSVADRKKWSKFGRSKADKPGPDPATTIVSEDIYMQFITNKEEPDKQEDDLKAKLSSLKGGVRCRICKEDHWTSQCPYKDTLEPLKSTLSAVEEKPAEPTPEAGGDKGKAPAKYVPPSLRDGANKRGETMASNRTKDESTIRVSNLSENTRETDLTELFKQFGPIQRIFLAKDKQTGASKGFAFVSFHHKEHAAAAIRAVHGFGYDYLILNVDWAKPSGPPQTPTTD